MKRIATVRVDSTPILTGRFAGARRRGGDQGVSVRSYHDLIEVHRGLVGGHEVPAQFRWRDRLWIVGEVISHWVETGAWWQPPVASSRSEGAAGRDGAGVGGAASSLLREREFWRVEARRHRRGPLGAGVFDLAYDHDGGQWHLICVLD